MCHRCFKQLGVKSKLEIFNTVKRSEEASVGEIVKRMNLTQPTVSHHLSKMEEAGLLKKTKKGRKVFYSVNITCLYGNSYCALAETDFYVKD